MRRRAPCDTPSSIRLDHGDILVIDGLAPSENVHRTMPGLQGPQIKRAYCWKTQYSAVAPQSRRTCLIRSWILILRL